MPTLTNTEPDSYNIDYFYSKYKDCYSVGMSELKEETLRVLSARIQPTICEVNNLKKQYYFKVLIQLQIATCLCNKYHTSFTSRYYKISHLPSTSQVPMDISPNISTKRFNRITEELPSSPISKKQDLPNPKILFPLFQTDPTLTKIILHS